ncbi:MAG: hypothetical protein OEM52_07440 [bacterium]|nr:hypothetical protein [bacterium]
MNRRTNGDTEPVTDSSAPNETTITVAPEYRVNVLLPELKQYPTHVVNAVLAQHGLTPMSLISKSRLVELIESWLKGDANG